MRCYQTCMRPCESLLWICILLANLPQNLKEWRGTSCKPLIPTCPLQKKTYWKGRCTHQFHLPCWFYDKQLELQQMAWDGKQWKTTFKNNICISTPLHFLACTRSGLKQVGLGAVLLSLVHYSASKYATLLYVWAYEKKYKYVSIFDTFYSANENQRLKRLPLSCILNRPFATMGHVTYPPLHLIHGTLWILEMERVGKIK